MIDIRQDFRRGWRQVWISTFTLGVVEMEDYLLNQLGEPPIEVTVLADADRLQKQFHDLVRGDQVDRLSRVGTQYVVRGVRAAQRFHPKTYFFGNTKRGVLLVGSGNAGLNGLLNGAETFSRFKSEEGEGLDAIRSWRDWMTRIVQSQGEELLSDRWRQLMKACSAWLTGPTRSSVFVTNEKLSIGEQVVKVAGSARTLFLTAPYFDERAEAVMRLLKALKPAKVRLWLGDRPTLNGKRLRKVLTASGAKVDLARYEGGFVHAKLIGVVAKRSYMLSGSANLSTAGLWLDSSQGNCEAGVLTEASPELIGEIFENPGRKGLSTRPMDWSELEALEYEKPAATGEPLAVRLVRATRLLDGTCEFESNTRPLNCTVRSFGAATEESELGPTRQSAGGVVFVSVEPIPEAARLVGLVGNNGELISNLTIIEDPDLLKAMGQEVARSASGLGSLSESDMATPVGQLLDLLRRSCNFDYAWQAKDIAQRLAGAEGEKEGVWDPDTDIEFAAAGIRRRRLGTSSGGINHLAFDELHSMLQAVPTRERLLSLVKFPEPESHKAGDKGQSWSTDRRLGVRLFNVLERWCQAIGLTEAWYDEMQAVSNFKGLVAVLSVVSESDDLRKLLSAEKLALLVGILFRGFVGTGARPGYFRGLDAELQAQVVAALDSQRATYVAGTLLGELLDPHTRAFKTHASEWKPWLGYGLDLGLIKGDNPEVRNVLSLAADYMDENMWIESIRERFGLRVSIVQDSSRPTLAIARHRGLLSDPLIVRLVHEYFKFRPAITELALSSRGVVSAPDERLGINLDDLAAARRGDAWVESNSPITKELIARLVRDGRPWAECFDIEKLGARAVGA